MCFETQDLKRIPIPVADFEVLRKSGQIYVDKTALIFDLVTCGQPVFSHVRAVLVNHCYSPLLPHFLSME